MKQFIKKTLLFLCIPIAIFILGMLLPPTPRAKQSLLLVAPIKDSLLVHTQEPRIIFLSGSSIGFGLVSQMVKDSIGRNPINMGIHGGMGLYYLLDHTLPFVKKGDIVVLAPEYHQFYGNFCEGSEELVRVFFDNSNPMGYLNLRPVQLRKTYVFLPRYALSKFTFSQYFNLKTHEFYSKRAFNQYGDVVQHWGQTWPNPVVFQRIDGDYFNHDVMQAVVAFADAVKAKGATLYYTFPAYQDVSFEAGQQQIDQYWRELQKQPLEILGTPERYRMTPDFIFDTPYHLNKAGMEKRTALLLEDLQAAMQKDGLK